jgi:hypothetical protein
MSIAGGPHAYAVICPRRAKKTAHQGHPMAVVSDVVNTQQGFISITAMKPERFVDGFATDVTLVMAFSTMWSD